TLNRLVVADRTGFEVTQHRVQLIELQLFEVQLTQEIRRKGAELLGGLDPPLQHRVRRDLEDPGRRTDPQALSQAGQDVHDALHRRLRARKNRAVGLKKSPLAWRAVELAPGTATGMAIGAQVAQPQPATIATAGMGTEVPRGVYRAGAPVGRG